MSSLPCSNSNSSGSLLLLLLCLVYWRVATNVKVHYPHSVSVGVLLLLCSPQKHQRKLLTSTFKILCIKELFIFISPDAQCEGEQRASLHPVSSRPAAGQPSFPPGRAAAQLHQRDAEEKHWQPVDGERRQSGSPPSAPLPQHTWIVPAVQWAEVVPCFFLFHGLYSVHVFLSL